MMKRLDTTEDPDGAYSVKMPPTNLSCKDGEQNTLPCFIAWERFKKKTNNKPSKRGFPDYIMQGNDITSGLWIAYGMNMWYVAMSKALGELCTLPHHKLSRMRDKMIELKTLRQRNLITEMEFNIKRFELTGQPPLDGMEHYEFLSCITVMGGDYVPIEFGGGKFIPSPPWLKWYQPQQVIALHMTNYFKIIGIRHRLGGINVATTDWKGGVQLVLSPAIVGSIKCFMASTGDQEDTMIDKEEGSPEEAVEFAKKMLASGVTWEDGVREYVGFVYRGTVLAAWVSCRLEGLGKGIKGFKWARKYLELADEEWNVSKGHQDYNKYGVTFQPTFRLGVMWSELLVAQNLRGVTKHPNLEEAVYEFDLALSMINIAKNTPQPTGHGFDDWMFYTCFGRKPLAFACSYLAGTMSSLKLNKDPNFLFTVIEKTGIMSPDSGSLADFVYDKSDVTELSVNSVIAETYRLAAINQLRDDKETSILWWGCAVHMAYAGGYEIVDFRNAIKNAIDASRERDELFGPDIYKDSTQQKQALLVARYYEEKPGDFILPMLTMESRPGGNIALFTDGQLLCMNFDKDLRIAKRHFDGIADKKAEEYLNIKEVEKEHGAES